MTTHLFSNFYITGSDGLIYVGTRPGEIPKPFKDVRIVLVNDKYLTPIHDPNQSEYKVIGYDASIKVIADPMSGPESAKYFYRIVTLYDNGNRFSIFFTMDGQFAGSELDNQPISF